MLNDFFVLDLIYSFEGSKSIKGKASWQNREINHHKGEARRSYVSLIEAKTL